MTRSEVTPARTDAPPTARPAALLAASLTALLHGCYSFSTYARARTLDAGHTEAWIAPEALIVAGGGQIATRPVGELGVRYGVTDRVELDARVTTLGVTAGPRLALVRAPDASHGVDLTLAPALAFTWSDRLALELPVQLGINLAGGHAIVLAPRLAYQLRFGAAGYARPVSFVYAGGSVGFAWRVGTHVVLMPEVALLGELYAEPGFASNVSSGLGIQTGFGVLYEF